MEIDVCMIAKTAPKKSPSKEAGARESRISWDDATDHSASSICV